MLIALVSAAMCHELYCLDTTLMQDNGNRITFQMGRLTKSQGQGRPHQSLTLSTYVYDEDLDVVKCTGNFWRSLRNFELMKDKNNSYSVLC